MLSRNERTARRCRAASWALLCLLLVVVSLGSASNAFAANPGTAPNLPGTVGGPGTTTGASTGTLVAAVMETVGYVSQAQLLSQSGLGSMLERLGSLLYLCSIFSAILAVAIAGRYEVALWLLIGPPMFHFLIAPPPAGTDVGAGAEWQFGAFKDTFMRNRVLKGADVKLSEGQNVSWFFHSFNIVVSDTIQQLITFITDGQIRQQMLFQTRQQVMGDLLATNVESPNLMGYVAFLNQVCSAEMDAGRLLALGQRDPNFRNSPDYQRAVKTYCDTYENEKTLKELPNGSPAKQYVAELQKSHPDTIKLEALAGKQSCKQLWAWLMVGIKDQARIAIGASLDSRVQTTAPDDIYSRIIRDINAKITSEEDSRRANNAPPFECAGANGTTVTRPPPDGAELTQLIFSAWIVRKVLSQDNRGQMLAQFAQHGGIELQPYNYTSEQSMQAALDIQQRFRIERMAETTRYEAYTIAMTLPYIQGAGLYILATVFPFFAMLVLIPGQAGSFFMWCALWIWFKSWDVGWALVMVADELLWSLMPHSAHFRLGAVGGPNAYDAPITIFEAAFGGDSSYNLATYYMLVSGMLTAVPVLSANAILGSKKAVAGILLDGVKTMGTALATHVGDQISVEQIHLNRIDFRREMAAAREAFRNLLPLHIEMLVESQMWGSGQALSNEEIGRMTDQMLKNYRDTVGERYKNAGIGANLDADEAQLRKDIGSPAQIRARLERYGSASGSERNKFLALSKALVKQADGSYKELGQEGALGEVLRQAKAGAMLKSVRENSPAAAAAMAPLDAIAKQANITIPEKAPEFKDPDAALKFKDPLERFDYRAGPSSEYDVLRRSLEHQRSLGHYFQGMAQQMGVRLEKNGVQTELVAAALSKSPATYLLGEALKMGDDGTAKLGIAFWEAGMQYERSAGRMSLTLLNLSQKDYYYQATKSDTWRFYDNIRAGVTLREEWWNTPDAPANNRALAHYAAQRSRDESSAYVARFFGQIMGDPSIPAGAYTLDKINDVRTGIMTQLQGTWAEGALNRLGESGDALFQRLGVK